MVLFFGFNFMKKFLTLALFLSLFLLTACGSKVDDKKLVTNQPANSNMEDFATSTGDMPPGGTTTPPKIYDIATSTASTTTGISNPAANYCVAKEGTLRTVTRADGNQYTVCDFMENRQCEEWALFRGDCPWGGRKLTGYDNEQQKFCAITGGEVDMNKNTCTFKGKVCDLGKYYDGACDN